MVAARPFVGAWCIWLGGYALLLIVDLALREVWQVPRGVSAHLLWVATPVTVSAGAAAGYFLAAATRWRVRWRIALLLLQVPPAYLAAVSMGIAYLCMIDVRC